MEVTAAHHYKAGLIMSAIALGAIAPAFAAMLMLDGRFATASIVLAAAGATLGSKTIRHLLGTRKNRLWLIGFAAITVVLGLGLRQARDTAIDLFPSALVFLVWLVALFYVIRKIVGPFSSVTGRI